MGVFGARRERRKVQKEEEMKWEEDEGKRRESSADSLSFQDRRATRSRFSFPSV